MSFLIDQLWKTDLNSWSPGEVLELSKFLYEIFSDENCILRSILQFCLMFCTFKVDITWLDEIAEGIKNAATALSEYETFNRNLSLNTK